MKKIIALIVSAIVVTSCYIYGNYRIYNADFVKYDVDSNICTIDINGTYYDYYPDCVPSYNTCKAVVRINTDVYQWQIVNIID